MTCEGWSNSRIHQGEVTCSDVRLPRSGRRAHPEPRSGARIEPRTPESVTRLRSRSELWNEPANIPAPEGRMIIAQRFQRGKVGEEVEVPEGRLSLVTDSSGQGNRYNRTASKRRKNLNQKSAPSPILHLLGFQAARDIRAASMPSSAFHNAFAAFSAAASARCSAAGLSSTIRSSWLRHTFE